MADKMPSSPSERENTRNTRLAVVLVVAFIILVLLMFYSGTVYKRRTNIIALRLQLSELTMKQLRAKTVNADTNKLNKQIEELRSRLAFLEQKNEEYRKHGGARIEEYRKQYETQMRREADSASHRRCDALKEKHISDLTLDDVELLKECGEPKSQLNPSN
jgi:chromosome segregation ATPase